MTPSFFNINSCNQKSSTPPKCVAAKIDSNWCPCDHHRPGRHLAKHHHTHYQQQQRQKLTNPLAAKLFASNGCRRRSYDDQEGDNDINIILQPSDIDDIEKRARLSYARLKATTAAVAAASGAAGLQRTASPAATPAIATGSEIGDEKHDNNDDKDNQTTNQQRLSKLKAFEGIFEDIKLAKCLLDQDYNQTVRLFIERSALNWNFNSFTFDALCCGKSLTELLLHLFDYYNLYAIFDLDIIKVLKCFRLLEFGYHSTNPYHNSVHAADVTQAMHCFIQENKIRSHMTNLEILCSILAAVCHDLDHPGVNQSLLVATNNPLASLYNNNSVLENHHWRFALCIFKESKLFDHFDQDTLDDMKQQLKQLILATDIARQNDYLKRFKALTSSKQFSMSNTDDRALVLQMALKCADLGNPCRPWLISRVWSNLICDEFYRMGQIERRLGIPLTPICQRNKTSIAGIQADFFRFIVLPLLELWHNFLNSPLSSLLMSNFDQNYQRWQRANRIVQQLRRRKSVASLEPVKGANGFADEPKDFHGCDHREPAYGKQARSSSLFQRTIIEIGARRDSFELIKRASSDYIKSGNGKLESLRDFQMNRTIEQSPVISRASRFVCAKQRTLRLAANGGGGDTPAPGCCDDDDDDPCQAGNWTPAFQCDGGDGPPPPGAAGAGGRCRERQAELANERDNAKDCSNLNNDSFRGPGGYAQSTPSKNQWSLLIHRE
jgi:hypothetical protein